jgi:hypothetical protein
MAERKQPPTAAAPDPQLQILQHAIQAIQAIQQPAEEKKEAVVSPTVVPPTVVPPRDQGEIFTEAVTHLLDREQIPPFEEEKFTADSLTRFIEENIDEQGLLPDEKQSELDKQINDELLKARNNPERILGILATIGRSSRLLDDAGTTEGAEIFESILSDKVPLDNPLRVRGSLSVSQDVVPDLIFNLFGADLQRLQTRNLGQTEILAIRRDFQEDLENLEEKIKATTEGELEAREAAREAARGFAAIPRDPGFLPPVFGQGIFQALQNYIDKHVVNDQLRILLLNDIENRISADRDKIGVRLGNAPRQITPLSATSLQIIREPLAEGIGSVLGESLDRLNRRQARILTATGQIDRRKTRQKALVDEDTRSLVEDFNGFIRRNQIKDPRTGLLQLIPLRREVATDEPPSGLEEDPEDAKTEPIPTADLLVELANARQQYSRFEQSFSRVPIRQRDSVTGTSRDQILQDLQNLQRSELQKNMDPRLPGIHKHPTSTISRRAKLPGVEIRRGRRMPVKTLSGVPRTSAMPREIKVNENISLEELAKISNMIAQESGTLEDVRHQPLLDVQRGVTPIQSIVAVFVDQQRKHSGKAFSLIYVPHNIFGGMLLDGSLDVIHKNRQLVNPVDPMHGTLGGNIFSDILNVGKSIVTAPLGIVSGLLGGGLHRPIDAPQHGGDLRDTFTTGEHQVEPHVASSHGNNHIFKIQPFTNGKIDNSGYIDQTHIPHDMFGLFAKHEWADTPVNAFHHFR